MNLYIMRHGTTIWNEQGISQGRSNNMLSKAGIELVNTQAERCKDTQFDIIVSSPLKRTLQTANIMNKYHNVKKFIDTRIIEIDQGIFTGQKISKLPPEMLAQRIRRAPECGIEQKEDIFERTKNFFDNIKKDYPYENILVITHNWIASILEILILNQKEYFNDTKYWSNFENAQIKKFEI